MRVSVSRSARWALACSLAGPIAWVSTGRSADASEPTPLRRPLEAWCASIVESLTKPMSFRVDLSVEPVDDYPYDGYGLETWTDASTVGATSVAVDAPAAEAPLPAWYCQWFDDCGAAAVAVEAAAASDSSPTVDEAAVGEVVGDAACYAGQDLCDYGCDEVLCGDGNESLATEPAAPIAEAVASDDYGSEAADCGEEWLMAIVAPPVSIEPAATGIVTHLVNDLRHSTGQLVAIELNRLSDGLGEDVAPVTAKSAASGVAAMALATPRPAVLSHVEAPTVAEHAACPTRGNCDKGAQRGLPSAQPEQAAQAVARGVARGWYGALVYRTAGMLAATYDASTCVVRTLADQAFAWPLAIAATAEAARQHDEPDGALEF